MSSWIAARGAEILYMVARRFLSLSPAFVRNL
jgi:hypothetical protein